MTGRHTTILVSTMMAGHTKFWCDLAGGTFKRKWSKSKASSMAEIAQVVEKSTPGGHNVPQLLCDETIFYEWSSFFTLVFRNNPNITEHHHFRFTAEKPGVVYLRELVDQEEVAFQMLLQPKLTFPDHVPSDPSVNKGIALDRQWYLYEKVLPYCTEETADQVCPQPKEPKPAAGTHQPGPTSNASGATAAGQAKCVQPTCSHCKQSGHRRTSHGVVTCPQLTGEGGVQ